MTPLLAAKVTLLLSLVWAAMFAMKHASAASRHLVIVAALVASLLLPVFESTLPAWRVLPLPSATAVETSPTIASDQIVDRRTTTQPRATGRGNHTKRLSWPHPVSIWLCGVLLLTLLLAARVLAVRARVQRATPLGDARWNRLRDEAVTQLNIQCDVRIHRADEESMPAVWGLRTSTVLLPASATSWSTARCRDVLVHELAHVARRDVLSLLIAHLVCAVYWFVPFAWVLKKRLQLECELAADDLALQQGRPAAQYAAHLLNTAEEFSPSASIAPVMASRSQLEERIMAILEKKTRGSGAVNGLQFAALALAAAMIVPLSSMTWAQSLSESASQGKSGFFVSDSTEFAARLDLLGIDKSDTDALLIGLADADAVTRAASAWALGGSDDPQVVAPLVQAGYDTDARVRQWAIRSLDDNVESGVAQMLSDRLQDGDAEVRQWAARSFAAHDQSVRSQPLLNALADDDDEVREWAARSLADINDPAVIAVLADRIAVEPNAEVSEWLVRSIDSDHAGSTEAFVAATYSPTAEVRQWAARGLAGATDQRAVDALIALLGDTDDEVRQWSVRGLGVCGNDRAVPALQAMSADPDGEVREWAGRSLENIRC